MWNHHQDSVAVLKTEITLRDPLRPWNPHQDSEVVLKTEITLTDSLRPWNHQQDSAVVLKTEIILRDPLRPWNHHQDSVAVLKTEITLRDPFRPWNHHQDGPSRQMSALLQDSQTAHQDKKTPSRLRNHPQSPIKIVESPSRQWSHLHDTPPTPTPPPKESGITSRLRTHPQDCGITPSRQRKRSQTALRTSPQIALGTLKSPLKIAWPGPLKLLPPSPRVITREITQQKQQTKKQKQKSHSSGAV